MSGRLWVDVSALRSAEPLVGAVADGIDAALRRLAVVLDHEGSCWGSDQTGQAFGSAYRPAAEQVRAGFTDVGSTVHGVAQGVGLVADYAEASDGRAQLRYRGGAA